MANECPPHQGMHESNRSSPRLQSLDILRGTVIVLMALDHVREFFHVNAFLFDPLDLQKTSVSLYLTRWITNFCAPTFFFLAGVAAFLYAGTIHDCRTLSRFLITRGFWLIIIEFVVVNFAWNFTIRDIGLQVLWAIGVSMIVLSGLVWLPRAALLAFSVLVMAGHNVLDNISSTSTGQFSLIWMVLHEEGKFILKNGLEIWVVYPLIPWMGVMSFGYGLGVIFQQDALVRSRKLTVLGLLMVMIFFASRKFNVYGDPRPWILHDGTLLTVGDFLNTQKYPPSLFFILMTLGPVLIFLPWLERGTGFIGRFFATFGRVPLFFYVIHLYLAHALMLVIGVIVAGVPAEAFIGITSDPSAIIDAGWGYPLPTVYAIWLLILVILYPICAWLGKIKQQRRLKWMSYF